MLGRAPYQMSRNPAAPVRPVWRVLVALVAAGLMASFATPALAANQAVSVGDNFFQPQRVGVKPGESVTWTASGGNPHNVRFEDGVLIDPLPARPGPWTTARTFAAEGVYPYYCEIHGGPGGQGMSGTVYVNAAANVPPTARFIMSPRSAQAGEAVSFDGSISVDSDGSISQYEWDLDGNGSFETNSGASATVSRSYTSPGTVTVRLRVTDNAGASHDATESLLIAARPAINPPPVVAPVVAGPPPVVAGPPHTGGSSPLPPSFAASKKSITVSKSGRFTYALRAGPGLAGTIDLQSVSKVKVSARRRIGLGTKRFTVPESGAVEVTWNLSRKNLRILRRSKRITFRVSVTLRNAAGAASAGATTLTLRKPRR